MTTDFKCAVGQTVFLPITVTPPNGDISSLTYHALPATAASLVPGVGGVNVKRLTADAVQIFADVNGADATGAPAKIEAESDSAAVVTVPLVTALVLGPAAS